MIVARRFLGDAGFFHVESRFDVFDQPGLLAEDLLAGLVKIDLVGRVGRYRASYQKGCGAGQR